MHRRHLMTTALITLIPRTPLSAPVGTVHSVSNAEDVAVARASRAFVAPGMAEPDELAALNAKVWEFASEGEAAAVFAVAAEQLAPEQQPFGEIYVIDIRVITPIPGLDVPARLLTWRIVAGAAAVETSYGMVIMHRDRFLWGLFAQSGLASGVGSTSFAGPGEILADLAVRLSDRQVRREDVTRDDDGLFRGGLWDLLPELDDVPDGMELADQRIKDDSAGSGTPTAPCACTPPARG